jgi:hypothetical protein
MRLISSIPALFLLAVALCAVRVEAQHAHITAGGQGPGSKLFFINGYLYTTNSYGGVYPACVYMDITDARYPGLHQNPVTFTSAAVETRNGGPDFSTAERGTIVELVVVSVDGPPGGKLIMWDENITPGTPTKLFTVPVGSTGGTNRIEVSEGDREDPGTDPYGHIHGRRFTADKPGLYTVGLQLIDTSKWGPNDGPIHQPSDVSYFYFQAGLTISGIVRTNGVTAVRAGLKGFTDYFLESSPTPNGTNWSTVILSTGLDREPGAPHSDVHWFIDDKSTNSVRFYRIRPVGL